MKTKLISLLTAGMISAAAAVAPSAYVHSIEQWRHDEEVNLKKENGWPTVDGLFGLKAGGDTGGPGRGYNVTLTDHFKPGTLGAH